MRIVSIQARAIDCGFQNQVLQTSRVASPMSRFPKFGEKRASWMWPTKKVFVRIESGTGEVGWSCTNGGEIVALIINEHLSRLLTGENANDLSDIWDQMFFSLLPCDRSGFSMMAIAGVDIALWDLTAKAKGCPLVDLLGGARRDRLRAYVTTPQPEIQAGRGWSGLKAAAPFGPETGEQGIQANVEYMRRFRDLAGPDVPIMIDAFMAWDADYTLRFAEAADELNLDWIEDPLPPYDLDGMRRVKRELGNRVRLALGNFAFNRWDCTELLEEGLVDVLQPDVAWAGGITETMRILDITEEAGVPVILHNTCEQPWALALAAARQADGLVEFVDRGDVSQLYSLMGPRVEIEDGWLPVTSDLTGNLPPDDIIEHFGRVAERSIEQGR
ncbi:MAG: mandelate racemase/muconate lactonizing enzyme family protein [Alphaproteobacteria bacterium]|nr:mandelate racemase/muconate lactonizing enzyme family protein [Alphaproteobacteria bacterium]